MYSTCLAGVFFCFWNVSHVENLKRTVKICWRTFTRKFSERIQNKKENTVVTGRKLAPKKRKSSCNQHTAERETDLASTSAEKVRRSGNTEIPIHEEHGYCILNLNLNLHRFFCCSAFVCKQCGEKQNRYCNKILSLVLYVAL